MSTCSSCGAPIFWATSLNGSKMPIDAAATIEGNVILSGGDAIVLRRDAPPCTGPRYTSHFATCPNAKSHRKAKS